MIVVKATYRNETRKFSFEYNGLPTYYDLQTQLCRVFPLLNFRSFYLSQLLFSPNAAQPGHFLMAREVHDLEGYSASTKPHQRYFVNALLKFTVIDKQHSESDSQMSVTRSNPSETTVVLSRSNTSATHGSSPLTTGSETSKSTGSRLVESIDQLRTNVEDLRKNLDTLTAVTLGSTGEPCSICKCPVGGLRYSCGNCDATVCSSCNLKGNYFCIVTAGSHSLKLAVTGQGSDPSRSPPSHSSDRQNVPGAFSLSPMTPEVAPPVLAESNMQVDDAPRAVTPAANITAPPPPPVIHEGIRCNGCRNVVEGTRHKCLDCPDYDMCTQCVIRGGLDSHDASHEWISLDKPTLVVIHKPIPSASTHSESSTVHNATCDLCDSVIVGQRFKCTVCPDFDTCKGCFSITGDQHPRHTFVRVDDPSAYIQRRDQQRPRHAAFCDVCRKTIYGIRYKCMHPQCLDFDLCENCEALPIPQHPSSHPFLKLRNTDAVVPTVNRPEQSISASQNSHAQETGSNSSASPAVLPVPLVMKRPESPIQENVFSTPPSHMPEPLLPESANIEDSIKFEAPTLDSTELINSRDVTLTAPWDPYRGLNALLHNDLPASTGQETPVSISSSSEFDRSYSGSPILKQETPAVPALPPLDSLPALSSNLFAPASNEKAASTLFGHLSSQDDISASPTAEPVEKPEVLAITSASCIGNITVPDGQVFPPGSTFMKCWKVLNDGNVEWPADTEVSFVGGDSFRVSQPASYPLGGTKPGEFRNAWTGELTAPERPGKYLSYWRLRDGLGNAFGQAFWIDIEVLEPVSGSAQEGNLSSSSIIVMPTLGTPQEPLPDSPKSTCTRLSIATEDDDALSDSSFASVGSSSDDEDADLWRESRSQIHHEPQGSHAADFVVLYDDNSSDEGL